MEDIPLIIDLILDRKCGVPYKAESFYRECVAYSAVFDGIGDGITAAMDYGTEQDVHRALCKYIDSNGYNPGLHDFIFAKKWLEDDSTRRV